MIEVECVHIREDGGQIERNYNLQSVLWFECEILKPVVVEPVTICVFRLIVVRASGCPYCTRCRPAVSRC